MTKLSAILPKLGVFLVAAVVGGSIAYIAASAINRPQIVPTAGEAPEFTMTSVDSGTIVAFDLIDAQQDPTLLEGLRRAPDSSADWKKRGRDNRKRMASGSAFELAETVTSLELLSATRKLSFGDSRMLVQARGLLIDEISSVMGTTKGTAEEQIDRSLAGRTQA